MDESRYFNSHTPEPQADLVVKKSPRGKGKTESTILLGEPHRDEFLKNFKELYGVSVDELLQGPGGRKFVERLYQANFGERQQSTENTLQEEDSLFLSTVKDVNDLKDLTEMFKHNLIFCKGGYKKFRYITFDNFDSTSLPKQRVEELAIKYCFIDPWDKIGRIFEAYKNKPKELLAGLVSFPVNGWHVPSDSVSIEMFNSVADNVCTEIASSLDGYFQSDFELYSFVRDEFGDDVDFSGSEYVDRVGAASIDIENVLRNQLVSHLVDLNSIFVTYHRQLQKSSNKERVVENFGKEIETPLKLFEKDLQKMKSGEVVFLNAFKFLRQHGASFGFEDIRSASVEIKEGGTLSKEDISTMRSTYSHNQQESAVHNTLLAGFDKKVQDPKTTFTIFKWQGKVQSFMALSDIGDSLYMSSVNVEPSARGHKIGEAMLDQVVGQEAKNHVITADCDAKLPVSSKYIETGFIGTFYWEDKNEETGKSDWVIDIKRDDTVNSSYWGKQQTSNEAIINSRSKHPDTVMIEVAKTQAELPFHLLQEGYVLTRMFKDTSGLCYGVFEEKEKKELSKQTITQE